LGSSCPEEQTPAALDALVRSEIDLWVPIIKKAGVVAQ
jgi:tripartite-type tricarboxylate transporter receptor subunit TctC